MKTAASKKSWCYLSRSALTSNVQNLKKRVREGGRLGVVVKSNAYGHGMALSAKAFASAGADWLIVNDVDEALELRRLGLHLPVYICGPVAPEDAAAVVEVQARVVVTHASQVDAFAEAGRGADHQVPLHVKIETGCNRQGVDPNDALPLVKKIWEAEGVMFEGSPHTSQMWRTPPIIGLQRSSWRRLRE